MAPIFFGVRTGALAIATLCLCTSMPIGADAGHELAAETCTASPGGANDCSRTALGHAGDFFSLIQNATSFLRRSITRGRPLEGSRLISMIAKGASVGSTRPPNQAPGEGGRVAYLMPTGDQFYNTRWQWVRDTWGARLPVGATMLAVGDVAGPDVMQTDCKPNDHGLGICCKLAKGLQHIVRNQRGQFDWVFVSDDDSYVNTKGMRNALAERHHPEEMTMLGILGCNTDTGCSGFCGGGGIAISSKAAEAMVERGSGDFEEEFLDACGRCNKYGDMAFSEVGKKRGARLMQLSGEHGWRIEPAELNATLSSQGCKVTPLTFHYLQAEPEYMQIQDYLTSNPDHCNFA